MPSHNQLLLDVRQHLQESEAHAAYAAEVSRHYRLRDTASKWIVAIAALGPVIGRLAQAPEGAPSWLLAAIPLVAVALPLLNYSKKIELASSLRGKYAEIIPRLKALWEELCADEAPPAEKLERWHKQMTELDRRLAEIASHQSGMPDLPLAADTEADRGKYALPPFVEHEEEDAGPLGGATVISWGIAERATKPAADS